MLKKKEKLPMVAFTFSKRRIMDNMGHLQSVDLTTQAEKSEIHIFFHKCIQRLKGTDRQLPQVRSEIRIRIYLPFRPDKVMRDLHC
jgi:antiviral helicase SKI2